VDHLTVTWKVADGILQDIEVLEKQKANPFNPGQSFWIGDNKYGDIDEIIAHVITPMAFLAKQILDFKYFDFANGGSLKRIRQMLMIELEEDINKRP